MASPTENSSFYKKLALVMGFDEYGQSYNKLKHSVNNAREMRKSLEKIGFQVTIHTDKGEEASKETDLMAMIQSFAEQINVGDLVVFYFAGHAYQIEQTNFLIPASNDDIEDKMAIQSIGAKEENALKRLVLKNKSNATIFILDCCKPYRLNGAKTNKCKYNHSLLHENNVS